MSERGIGKEERKAGGRWLWGGRGGGGVGLISIEKIIMQRKEKGQEML